MGGFIRRSVSLLLLLSATIVARCALLEMSRILWTKAVTGGLAKIGKLDPLIVPVIKVDQSEGDTSYRMILTNLEIVGLNESTLESIHMQRGGLKSNSSELETGYMSYTDLRDAESIRYKFHTVTREPGVPSGSYDAVVSPMNRAIDVRPSSRYQEDRFGRLRQEQQSGYRAFEQNRQYSHFRQAPSSPDATRPAGFYRSELRAPSADPEANPGGFDGFRRPAHVRPVYAQTGNFQGYRESSQRAEDTVDCENPGDSRFEGDRKDGRRFGQRQQGTDGKYYGERVGDFEVSASETIETRLKNQAGVRAPASYNREQPARLLNTATSANVKSSADRVQERSGYIDIIYAGEQNNGSVKHFGNTGIDPKEYRRVYGIEDVVKNIRESTRFSYNFTDGEDLGKRNDMIKAAMKTKDLKNLTRYARNYQEQQGYFEEGMQLIYHYGGMDANNSGGVKVGDKRTKRAHSEKAVEDDVMHVNLRIRVPLLRAKSQYTLMGKVGKETLRGSGLFAGNFTDVVGDFTLELKKINEELIVRTAKAKLSAKGKRITLQGMDERGPVRFIFNHSLMAAEAIAAMLADDFASKGLSEKTADALIYRMYKDSPVN